MLLDKILKDRIEYMAQRLNNLIDLNLQKQGRREMLEYDIIFIKRACENVMNLSLT